MTIADIITLDMNTTDMTIAADIIMVNTACRPAITPPLLQFQSNAVVVNIYLRMMVNKKQHFLDMPTTMNG